MTHLDMDEAQHEAEQARWALLEAQHRLTGKCWQSVEVYPHPGCAEFAAPDTLLCDNPGQWWVMEADGPGFNHWDGWPEWWLVCNEHRAMEPGNAAVARADIDQ